MEAVGNERNSDWKWGSARDPRMGPADAKGARNAAAHQGSLDSFMLPSVLEQFGDVLSLFQREERSTKTRMREFGVEELD